MAGPAVTVVVPTFRRPRALARTLRSLADQDAPGLEWELIVVDNDEPPGVEETVRTLRDDIPAPVTLLQEERRGAAFARNRGIEAADGDVVAFIDDDVVADKSWLAAVSAPILEGRSEGAGGPVDLDPSVPLPPWLGHDWVGYLSHYDRGSNERRLPSGDYVLTANAAFATERLRALGGFDELLGPRHGSPMVNDDLDLCRRFAASGGRIMYVPDAVVVHDVPRARLTRRYLLRRAYAQGRSDWLLEREVNVRRPLGGAKGMLIHLGRLLGDRVREGPWHPDVAMGAALSVVHFGGFVREGAANKWRAARSDRGSAQ